MELDESVARQRSPAMWGRSLLGVLLAMPPRCPQSLVWFCFVGITAFLVRPASAHVLHTFPVHALLIEVTGAVVDLIVVHAVLIAAVRDTLREYSRVYRPLSVDQCRTF